MRGCATATTRGEVEERGDGDAGEAAKSLGHAATGAPLHGPTRLSGRRHVDLPRRGHVGAPCPPWQGFMQTKLEGSGCEWMRPRDSESELADRDEKEEKKEKEKKGYFGSSLINCEILVSTLTKIAR